MNDEREGVDTGNNDIRVDVDTGTNEECEDVDTGTNEICEDVDTGTNDVYVPADTDDQIYFAAKCDDWDNVRELFEERPELKTKPVNVFLETPLMVAVAMNSHEFVKQLLNNVETHDRDKWCGVDISGNNALHYAAKAGNIEDAKLMLQCLPETMTTIKKLIHGDTPVTLAAKLGRKVMIDEVFHEYADAIEMAYEYEETDLRIYKAALRNDWDDVRELFEGRPELKFKPVNERLETPLMIAVGTNCSHEFVKQLLNNVEHGDLNHDDEWCGLNIHGNNALHYAAKVGNLIDAKLMVKHLPITMQWCRNINGDTPATLAAKLARKDMIDEVFDISYITNNGDLIASAIQAGLLDLATRSFRMISENDFFSNREITSKHIVLEALAAKPDLFYSGNKLGFWGSLIYQCKKSLFYYIEYLSSSGTTHSSSSVQPHGWIYMLVPHVPRIHNFVFSSKFCYASFNFFFIFHAIFNLVIPLTRNPRPNNRVSK